MNTVLEGLLLYIGAKLLEAKAMTRGEYNLYRGWDLPTNENGDDAGFVVVYPDSYISWSPAAQFNEAYRQTTGMNFGLAIEAMKKGHKVQRTGWNGKGMWLTFVNRSRDVKLTAGTPYANAGLSEVTIDAHIDMYTAQGTMQPGWLASQADMLADDWQTVE